MAITRAVRDENGTLVGSIRYMVSLERADQQTFLVIIILVLAGAFIMLLLTFTGIYFIGPSWCRSSRSAPAPSKSPRATSTCASKKARTTSWASCATRSTTWPGSWAPPSA